MKGFKTFAFGLIVALLPLLDYVNGSNIFTSFISDPSKAKFATFAVGAMIIVLRAVTTTPMFQKYAQQYGLIPQAVTPPTADTAPLNTPTADAPVTDTKGA